MSISSKITEELLSKQKSGYISDNCKIELNKSTFIEIPYSLLSFFEEKDLIHTLTTTNLKKIQFYKCNDVSKLKEHLDKQNLNKCISTRIDDNYNIVRKNHDISTRVEEPQIEQPKYNVIKFFDKPKLFVNLFDIDTPGRITEGDLDDLPENNLTEDKLQGNILNIWDEIEFLKNIKYIRKSSSFEEKSKGNIGRVRYEMEFINKTFDDLKKKYIAQYKKSNIIGGVGEEYYFKKQTDEKIISEHTRMNIPNFNLETKDPVFYQKVIISEYDSNICLIGDLHSSLHSLCEILQKIKDEYFVHDTNKLKSNKYIIFLGDIVDRGPYSIELLVIIAYLKQNNMENIFIINGNHEQKETYKKYGLFNESNAEYNQQLNFDFLAYLPSCIILNFKGHNFHLCHGSFDVNLLNKTIQENYNSYKYNYNQFIYSDHLTLGFVDYEKTTEITNESDIIGIENFGVTLTVTKKDTENIVLTGFRNTKLNGKYKKKTTSTGKPYYKKKDTEINYYIFNNEMYRRNAWVIHTNSPKYYEQFGKLFNHKKTCAFIYSEDKSFEAIKDIKIPQWIECFEQQINKGKNLQWNDMTNDGGSLTIIDDRGNLIPKIYIQKYLQDFNINSIISGNQDTINIGCIFNNTPDVKQWDELIKKQIKFHIPKGYKDLKNSKIEINTEELVALVTSTAVYSKYSKKNLNKNCYLELK